MGSYQRCVHPYWDAMPPRTRRARRAVRARAHLEMCARVRLRRAQVPPRAASAREGIRQRARAPPRARAGLVSRRWHARGRDDVRARMPGAHARDSRVARSGGARDGIGARASPARAKPAARHVRGRGKASVRAWNPSAGASPPGARNARRQIARPNRVTNLPRGQHSL